MEKIRIKLLILVYGGEILEAKFLDELLGMIGEKEFMQFSFDRIPSKTEKEVMQGLDFLTEEKLINRFGTSYQISTKGRLKLSKGGFVAEAKKEKNSLFAFWLSVTALLISVISFFISLLK